MIQIERKKPKDIYFSDYQDIWVVSERKGESIKGVTFELLGKGKELAEKLGQKTCAVLLGRKTGSLCEELAAYGADKIYLAEADCLEEYTTDAHSAILAGLISKYKPNIVLYPATKIGRDLAPRVASILETGLTADCTDLGIKDGLLLQTRPAFGGNIMAEIICINTRPQMATVRPNVMKKRQPDYGRKANIVNFPVKIDSRGIRTVIKEIIKTTLKGVKSLDEAEIIVSGGRGVSSKENFNIIERLAELLNGAVGVSRAVVDLGWKPKSYQVGQSGTTVSPKLYLALGISGAIQHLVGIRGSDVIIAINKDPEAPIFGIANYGIIGDLHQVVPLLIEELERLR